MTYQTPRQEERLGDAYKDARAHLWNVWGNDFDKVIQASPLDAGNLVIKKILPPILRELEIKDLTLDIIKSTLNNTQLGDKGKLTKIKELLNG